MIKYFQDLGNCLHSLSLAVLSILAFQMTMSFFSQLNNAIVCKETDINGNV